MKILKLEISAFGPFKDLQVIDFTLFDKDKIFLIGGKTGSGKTTIFDAISYALFGKMTGEFKSESTSRSHYATKDTITYVNLTFEKNNKIYMIYRKPAYILEGKKSANRAEIGLYDITDGNKNVLSTKIAEANQIISKIIGFKYDQFKQIVVLPQGEFIKILNSGSKEREVLLSAILDTTVYSKITEMVKDKSNEIEAQIKTVLANAEAILKQNSCNNIIELEDKKNALENIIKASLAELNELKEALDTMKLSISSIEENNKNIKLIEEYKSQYKELINQNLDIEDKREYLRKLKIYKEISFYYNSNLKENNKLEEKKIELENENNKLSQLLPKYNSLDEENNKIEELRIKISDIEASITNLRKIANSIDRCKELKNNLDLIELNKQKINKDNENNENILKDNKQKLNSLKENKDNLSEFIESYSEEDYENAKKEYEMLNNKNKLEKDINNICNQINKIQNDIELNQKDLDKLTLEETKLNEQLTLNKLSNFKSLVKDNTPCPLCGSIHHPNIISDETDISIDYLNQIKTSIKKTEKLITADKALLDFNINLLKNLKENELFNLELDSEQILNNYNKFIELNKKYKAAIMEANNIDKEIRILDKEIETIQKIQKEYEDSIVKLEKEEQRYLSEYNLLKEEIDKHTNNQNIISLIENDTLELNRIKEEYKLLFEYIKNINIEYENTNNNITNYKNNIEAIEKEIANNIKEIDSLITNNNLVYSDFISSINDIRCIDELEKNIQSYDEKVKSYKNSIEIYQGLITSTEYIDTSVLKQQYSIKEEEYNTKNEAYTSNLAEFKVLESDISRYKALNASIEKQLEEFKIANELYQLCSGNLKGSRKISLQKFVLMKLLDKILVHANQYLTEFSSHRYTLLREESEASSDKGLELAVFDEHTGYNRSVSSLSGGESFITALALALGMSECIMRLNGGIKIDNIFIDEGFGSLDDEALNNAIEALLQLAANGRLIGIISHIDTIKAIVPQGIDVIKSKNGSKVSIYN